MNALKPQLPECCARVTGLERIVRNNRLTRDFLERLPYLIPLSVVIEVTGLTRHDVRTAVSAGRLRIWSLNGSRKGKYYREDVLALIGCAPSDQIRPHSPDCGKSQPARSTVAHLG